VARLGHVSRRPGEPGTILQSGIVDVRVLPARPPARCDWNADTPEGVTIASIVSGLGSAGANFG
jgi:hypothetical protein